MGDVLPETLAEFNVKVFCEDLYGGTYFIEDLKRTNIGLRCVERKIPRTP